MDRYGNGEEFVMDKVFNTVSDGLSFRQFDKELFIGTPMDVEGKKILLDLGDKSSRIFLDFMTRIAKFEELVDVGQRFLNGFYQNIEIFIRPQLHKTSNVVDAIIKTNHTDRLKAYIEAGCKPPHVAIQNINELHSFKQGLEDHLKKVNILLDELDCLKDEAICIAWEVNQSTSDLLDKGFGDDMTDQEIFSEEEETEPVHILDKPIFYTSMMGAVLGMLKLDYAMQENIIKSLNLNTSSSELESYCLMWDLRPYINDSVMRQAWSSVP